jgi:L-ascorbate oxidase
MKIASIGARAGMPAALSLLMAFGGNAAQAQTEAQRVADNPPLLQLKRKPAQAALRAAPPGTRAEESREASLDLNVVYTSGQLWNPAERRFDAVKLRSYQGASVNPDTPFISPMLDIKPGDTIRVALHNKLPADPTCTAAGGNVNVPHCFNGTNLHTHGLWVNPAGNGDNVLISINPGVSFEYEYNIPSDHPSGTFWYHTHLHGSTALQVSSGMAGALIIRGNRPPVRGADGKPAGGDIDTLLKPTRIQPFRERVVVMQQIQYACRDAKGAIKTNADGTYRCDAGDVGAIEGTNGGTTGYDLFGPGDWAASGRYTTINGRVLPTFKGASTGQVERWRVIHGGVRDSINLQFRKLKPNARPLDGLRAADNNAFIGENCTGEPLPQHLVAADGLTLAAAMKNTQTVFQPAYRWDALMVFPQAGKYCVIDADAPASASVNQVAPSRQLLGMVDVSPGRPVPADITAYLTAQLAAAAAVNMPGNVRDAVVDDLRSGLKLSSFVPHPTIAQSEVTGTQTLAFNIIPGNGTTLTQFQVDGKSFQPNRVDRVLKLHGVDEWTLTSDFVSHPFHIHVNPFQVVKILDPKGRDVSGPDAIDDADGTVDTQYRGLKGVWKDTLWVKNAGTTPAGKYTVVVRTRYQRYIGDYVLHCHILDHEDQGMMQHIRVSLPDGVGGTSQGHQH